MSPNIEVYDNKRFVMKRYERRPVDEEAFYASQFTGPCAVLPSQPLPGWNTPGVRWESMGGNLLHATVTTVYGGTKFWLEQDDWIIYGPDGAVRGVMRDHEFRLKYREVGTV